MASMKNILVIFLALFGATTLCHAQACYFCSHEWTSSRADGHAPIGVMGDHTHQSGEWMFSYRYINMNMDGNREGTSRLSPSEVLKDYMVTPTDMDMEMHMLGAMTAPTDWLTLTFMLPFVDLSMNHQTRSGGRFKTEASGLGDIRVNSLFRVFDQMSQRVHLSAGVSLPSGEIDERDDTPTMSDAKLPYPMQLGSGTVDLLPGITYLGQYESFSWGGQASGTLRLGENDNDYTLGNRFDATAWAAYQPVQELSVSFRTLWQSWGDIDGSDPDLSPALISTADPAKRGGERLDLGVGINLFLPSMKSLRLAVEYLFPVYQDLNGPQLEVDSTIVVGAQMTF